MTAKPKKWTQEQFDEYIDKDFATLSGYNDENIVKLFYKGITEESKALCFMELVKNGSLADLIK